MSSCGTRSVSAGSLPTAWDPVPRLRLALRDGDVRAIVTPVVLPWSDSGKPGKTCKLIEKALQQSGVDQPCEFEWSAFSQFAKSLSAHKYDRHKRPTGYIRPDHLLDLTAGHLKLRFNGRLKPVKADPF